MQKKKVGVYLFAVVLLAAGSNLHGMDTVKKYMTKQNAMTAGPYVTLFLLSSASALYTWRTKSSFDTRVKTIEEAIKKNQFFIASHKMEQIGTDVKTLQEQLNGKGDKKGLYGLYNDLLGRVNGIVGKIENFKARLIDSRDIRYIGEFTSQGKQISYFTTKLKEKVAQGVYSKFESTTLAGITNLGNRVTAIEKKVYVSDLSNQDIRLVQVENWVKEQKDVGVLLKDILARLVVLENLKEDSIEDMPNLEYVSEKEGKHDRQVSFSVTPPVSDDEADEEDDGDDEEDDEKK